MNILVTGSSGTIGTRLCETLLERGHTVIGFDWVKNKWNPTIDAVTTVIDLRDASKLLASSFQLSDTPDLCIHLAANARVYELVEHPERALDNFISLFNTLEFCRKNGIKRFMFASSRESYGNTGVDTYTEDMVRVEHCESPYTASKVGGEALVESYRRCYDIDQITFRFSNVYGAYDDSERVVPLFIRRCRANEPLLIFGKDKCLDFTYIDDCVHGICQAVEKFEEAKNSTYNIAFGEGTTIVRLAELIKELTGSSSEIVLGDSRTGEVTRYIADITKAKRILGYAPKHSFDEGVRKAVEWYAKNT